ncbi:unnamed protein product [Sphagnum jensenii]|uniref:Uncharacterized protein n=1 Tax=Sphagnum jensenii TaxID=128206 RepID=A0ABP0X7E5_9BRYO
MNLRNLKLIRTFNSRQTEACHTTSCWGGNLELQWSWRSQDAPGPSSYMSGDDEYSSEQITKKFKARLDERSFTKLKKDLLTLQLDNVERSGDVVYVTGYDEEVLNGQAILNMFRKYDSRATRLS